MWSFGICGLKSCLDGGAHWVIGERFGDAAAVGFGAALWGKGRQHTNDLHAPDLLALFGTK